MKPTDWVQTADGSFTRLHPEHRQSYHSLAGAYSECIEVFLQPVIAHLENQPQQIWHVLDIGFGLGLNWTCFIDYALNRNLRMRIDSLECDPDLLLLPEPKGLQGRVLPKSIELLERLKREKKFLEKNIEARIHLGDAKHFLKSATHQMFPLKNIILQDAFSPQIDPELWDESYFQSLSQHCAPDAIVATYCAASSVRRALIAAGFVVKKRPGFAGKRERLLAFRT